MRGLFGLTWILDKANMTSIKYDFDILQKKVLNKMLSDMYIDALTKLGR